MTTVAIIGAGLAGCECAWQLARAGRAVTLFEMKPGRYSPAHVSPGLAELVCSNSLRSDEAHTAVGLLKEEMGALGGLVMEAARETRVPAGKALAVDREQFSDFMTRRMEEHPLITLERREILSLSDPALAGFATLVVAAGPLAGDALAADLARRIGQDRLYFYDAIAPIVDAESVDQSVCYWASRYRPEDPDYLNCPMDEAQYRGLVAELLAAEKVRPRDFEQEVHFEGCLPVEAMAERGDMTLAFGPLKPVGLEDPRTGRAPFAVVQLRPENRAKTALNMVGFQTKLTYPEQRRVFRLIPGMEQAEFLRLGSIHRNTYVNAPTVLSPTLSLRVDPRIHLAGQIAGVEGYVESAACGLWLGLHLAHGVGTPPLETALGALLGHLRTPAKNFQPANVQHGLMPPLNMRAGKRRRQELYTERARVALKEWAGGLLQAPAS
jgi:methylenetetrahydrofolate--tRNA-(uracil-5-)-methyltransferase